MILEHILSLIAGVILYYLGMGISERFVRKFPEHRYSDEFYYLCRPAHMDLCGQHKALIKLWPLAWPFLLLRRVFRAGILSPLRAVYRLGAGRNDD